MRIPYNQLNKETLQSLIGTFVLQEGTDYGEIEYSLDEKIEHVMNQLRAGKVHITFDEESKSCNIIKSKT